MQRLGYSLEKPTKQPDMPMKAHEYEGGPLEFPCYVQRKLDGIRGIWNGEQLLSRKNLPIRSCPTIVSQLRANFSGKKLDGEIWAERTPLEILQGHILRHTPTFFEPMLKYSVFDTIDTELTYEERRLVLGDIFDATHPDYHSKIDLLPSYQCTSINFLQGFYSKRISEGDEGIIIRKPEGKYEIDKRSKNLLKYKPTVEEEFEIVGIDEGAKKTGIYVCRAPNGETFKATPAEELGRKQFILANKDYYIGRLLRVEFKGYTPHGVPKEARGIVVIRDRKPEKREVVQTNSED